MPYDPVLVQPMREELSSIGVQELMTPGDVEAFMADGARTKMIVVNSVCGCAAGSARPGVRLALQNGRRPELVGTVFAGQDVEATARAREYFAEFPPSSPSMVLFKDGEMVSFLPRHRVEGREPREVAAELV
ncbi:MAG: BrxA/BrxB family bacilliredoxin, partial [Planctomycetota bacterium]